MNEQERAALREEAERRGQFIAADGHPAFRVPSWREILALLSDVDEAERQRDARIRLHEALSDSYVRSEARLAQVPAVVEMVSDGRWTFEDALEELEARAVDPDWQEPETTKDAP